MDAEKGIEKIAVPNQASLDSVREEEEEAKEGLRSDIEILRKKIEENERLRKLLAQAESDLSDSAAIERIEKAHEMMTGGKEEWEEPIDPTKDGATNWDEWKHLGIGGFYLITEVEHVLLHKDMVVQETSLRLRYVGAGGCGQVRSMQT